MVRAYVYIMTNKANRVLYTGVTNDLARRIEEHREGHALHRPRSSDVRQR